MSSNAEGEPRPRGNEPVRMPGNGLDDMAGWAKDAAAQVHWEKVEAELKDAHTMRPFPTNEDGDPDYWDPDAGIILA